MPKLIFVNLPVRDLPAAIGFYKAIGCTQNEQFSDANAAMMAWSDTINFMLLTHDYFSTFTPKGKTIADAGKTTETLIALSFESREAVDAVCKAAAGAGGKVDVRDPQDMGFMYSRAFTDPDGHTFEPMWMDPAAIATA